MKSYESSGVVLQLPENLTLCGLGGCGKRMVGEICKHRWFLKHYSQGSRHLQIYTMDTDSNEKDQDEHRRRKVLDEVEKQGGHGNVDYTSLFLPHLATISQVSHLASEEIARKVKETKAEPKASVWWLNDNSDVGLKFDDLRAIDPGIHEDFSGGVHRRRAISKAIFYKVISEGQASGFPMFSNLGTNAIVVGLGGGTGSGMFIDLARYIRGQRGETAQIWLFAVLPTTKESEAEQVNAAIALTELEYINQKERLFNNIVLTSLGPTSYKKGEEARREVREFDAAFPYIFTNFFQIEKGDINISDAKKSYSSFILADAHIISYPVEELRNLKRRYEEVINELKGVTETRKKLNLFVGDLTETLAPHGEGIPTRDDFDYIKKEYGIIERVWSHDIGQLLNYQTNEAVEFFITNNIPEELRIEKIKSYDDLVDFIRRVKNFAQQVKEDELKDDTDKRLLRLLPESLQTLETTALIIKDLAGLREEAIRTTLIECLKGKEEVSQHVRDLNLRAKAVREEMREIKAKSDDKENFLEELERQKRRVEDLVKETLSAAGPSINEYIQLRGEIASVKAHEANLKAELDRLFLELQKREKHVTSQKAWLDKTGVTAIRGSIVGLKTDIRSLPLDDLSTVIEKIGLYYYYDMRIRQLDEAGVGSKVVGLITGKPQQQKIKFKESKQSEETFIKEHGKQWHISFSPSSFEPKVSEIFLSDSLDGRARKLKDGIIRDLFDDTTGDCVSPGEISAIFEGDDLRIRAALKEALLNQKLAEAKYELQLTGLKADISDLERQCDEGKKTLEVIEKVGDSVEGSFQYRRDINQHYNRYIENFVQIKDQKKFAGRTQKGLYNTTFGDINPKILSLIREDSTLADLDNDEIGKSELDKLVAEITATYKSLIDNHKLGVHNLMIPITTTESWSFGKVGLVVSSPSRYISESVADFTVSDVVSQEIVKTLALKSGNDAGLIAYNYTRPWEIALTFFTAAGFLDNISPLIAGGGYWEIYEKQKNNILHHVLLMNEGLYITRKRLLDLKEAGKLANRENSGSNVSKEVLELYDVKQIREALPQ